MSPIDLSDLPPAIDLSDFPRRPFLAEEEPVHFDLEGTLDEISRISPSVSDDPRGDFGRMVWTVARPFVSTGYNAASALNRGMGALSEHLDIIQEYISDVAHTEKVEVFEKAARQYEENAEYWKKRVDTVGSSFMEELLGEALGGAVPGITEFMLNVPYAAALGAAEAHKEGQGEILGALTEAAKRGVLGMVFRAMHPLKQYLRAPVMGTVFGAQTALEGGDMRETAKGFGTGALYSLSSPGGKMGLNDIGAEMRRAAALSQANESIQHLSIMKTISDYERSHAERRRQEADIRRQERNAEADKFMEAQEKENADFMDYVQADMLSMVSGGSAGQQRDFNEGGGWEVGRVASGYPQWFRDICKKHKTGRDEFLRIVSKYENEQPLTDRQQRIYDAFSWAAIDESRKPQYADIEEVLKGIDDDREFRKREDQEALKDEIINEIKAEESLTEEEFREALDDWDRIVSGESTPSQTPRRRVPPDMKDTGMSQVNIEGGAEPILEQEPAPPRQRPDRQLDLLVRILDQEVPGMDREVDNRGPNEQNYIYETKLDKQSELPFDEVSHARRTDLATAAKTAEIQPEIVSRAAGTYRTRTVTIRTPADAAHLSELNIGDKAQEHFLIIMMDAEQKVIGVHQYSKGTSHSAPAEMGVILGHALTVPDVKSVLLAHNHPSGNPQLSKEDQTVFNMLRHAATDTGVDVLDMIAVVGKVGDSPGEYSSCMEGSTGREIPQYAGQPESVIPVVERIVARPGEHLRAVSGSADMMIYGKERYPDGALLLLNPKNEIIGAIRIPDYGQLQGRTTRDIVTEIHKTNAMGMIVYDPTRKLSSDEMRNLQRFATATSMDLYDIIDGSGSAADRNSMPPRPYRTPAPDEYSYAFQPAKDFKQRTPEEETDNDRIYRRSDIVKLLRDKLDIPIRTGRFRDRALGIFKVRDEVVRTRQANDIEVIAHEIGHALNKFLWGLKKRNLNTEPFTYYADELGPIATQPKAGQPVLQEGFAEFVRLYVTDNNRALQVAPRFHRYFEETLRDKAPEVKEIFLEARRNFEGWLKQPPLHRILGQMSVDQNNRRATTLDDLYTAGIDDLFPLRDVVNTMTKGKAAAAADDPYVLARLLRGWTGKAQVFLRHRPFTFGTYEDAGKSLHEILQPVKTRLDEFRAYVVAKRTLELKGRDIETGILPADARWAVDAYESDFAPVFAELKEYQDLTLQYLRDSGVIGEKAYTKIKKLNDDYVPLYRVMEESAREYGIGTGMESRDPVKRIKGSARDIQDPLESIVKNTYLYINLAEKNAVGRALVELAEKTGGQGKFIERIPQPLQKIAIREPELMGILTRYGKWTETSRYRETQKKVGEKITAVDAEGEGLKPIDKVEERAREALQARGFSQGETEQILNRLKGAKTPEAKSKIIERTIEKIVVKETVQEFGLELPGDTVEIFRASAFVPKDNVISVWRDGKRELYEVHPDVARTFQALDREDLNLFVKLMAIPAKMLRAGAVLTPEFMIRNPLRDQFSAFVYSKYGFIPGVDLARGMFHLVRRDDMYKNWMKAGGVHSMLTSMDRTYMQDNLGDVLQKYPVKNLVKNPIELLRVLTELTEAGTRLGEFSRGYPKEGGGKAGAQAAAFSSREVTLDFARIGAKTKAVNALIAFWNAQIQGGDRMVRAFKDNPLQASWKAVASITVPSIALAIANHDDPRWKHIPQWEKDLFWIVMTDDHVWRIPKPFGLGILFGSVPERVVEYILDRDPDAFHGLLESLGRGMSPGMIPTGALPYIENWANKSLFFDRGIVPPGREDVLPEYQYQPYTTETAKLLGRFFGKLPDLPDIDVLPTAPAKVENLIRGWTGGLGMHVLKILDAGLDAAGMTAEGPTEPTKTLSDIPFIKAFAVRYPSASAEPVARFYEDYDAYRKTQNTIKTLAEKENNPAAAAKLLSKHKKRLAVNLDMTYQSLRNMHRVVDAIYSNPDMTGDEKRELIDITYMGMISVAERGEGLIKAMKERD